MKLIYKVLLIITVFFNGSSKASVTDDAFESVSTKYNVPVSLLRAICWAESDHNPLDYNHHDGGITNSSFGICQVLYTTAQSHGFHDSNCLDDFSNKKDRTYNNCKLFGIRTNITYGALELKRHLTRYNNSWINAIVAYNAGSVKICRTGYMTRKTDNRRVSSCKIGGFLNQTYLDRVLKALDQGR